VLKNTQTKLCDDKLNDDYYRHVRTYVLNPKSVTLGELYGEMNPFTLEWKDGLLGIMMRTAVQVSSIHHAVSLADLNLTVFNTYKGRVAQSV
jgi:dynein heavy chain